MPKYTIHINHNGVVHEVIVFAEHRVDDMLRAASAAMGVAASALKLHAAWIHRDDGKTEKVH
jgi:hypothetical protein